MDKKIKKDWIKALRSGNYKQGSGQLQRTDGSFCCLGVLCELAVKAGVAERRVSADNKIEYGPVGSYGISFMSRNSSYLPPVVRDWAGLEYTDPKVWSGRPLTRTRLSDLNDDYGRSFRQIARRIRWSKI